MVRFLVLILVACGSPQAAGPPPPTVVSADSAVTSDAGTTVAAVAASDAGVARAPLSHVSCHETMTQPPSRPDTECGSCYKDWEEEVQKFQPVRIVSCATCETDADCGGTPCVRAAGYNDSRVKVCTSQRCDGIWRTRGKRATCEPMRGMQP